MRLNVRQIRATLWLLNLVALLCVGWFFYQLLEKKKAGELKAKPIDEWQSLMKDDRGGEVVGGDKLNKVQLPPELWKFDVTGKETSSVAADASPKQATPPPSEVKPIDQVLELKAIFAPSQAVVSYKDTGQLESLGEKILMVGSPLRHPYSAEPYNAKVLRITKDEVAFQWGKEESAIKINKKVPGQKGPALPMPAISAVEKRIIEQYQEPPENTKEVEKDHFVLSDEDQKAFANTDEFLKSEARITDTPDKKGNRQITLGLKKTDGRLAALGFESGDILISVNDVPMKSKSQGIQWARANPNLPSYKIVIERRGQQITKTIYAPRKKGGD
ncbi:MAG: hypothetical protein U1E76_07635 [Planctomycetota bacterium]